MVAVSGSALPGGLATRFMDAYGDVLYNLYGSTEVVLGRPSPTPADLRAAPDTAGRPPHGTRSRSSTTTAGRCRPAQVGRIFVGNEMLFEGYTAGGRPGAHDGLLATGDLGRVDADGRLFVDGRDDDMIVSGGENVFPSEVEDLLARPAAGPRGRGDRRAGPASTASGSPPSSPCTPARPSTPTRYASTSGTTGPGSPYPADVIFLTYLPRNATGKVLTRELRRYYG